MANNDDVVPEANIASGSELSSLKQQRTTMKRNVSSIHKKVEKDGDKTDATILQCRLEILESYFKQLCHIQSQIEKICPSDANRSDLEEIYITAKAKLLTIINRTRSSTSMEQSFFNTSLGLSNQTRLPSLKLPRFDGKYADYKRFITTFNNMVHDNSSLTPVDKFNYLLNCLSGPALAVIEPFQVTDGNYPKALERLRERYDNKVLIFLDHITALFNVPDMSKGNSSSLRHIIDTVSAIRGSLLSLGSELDVMNAIIIHIVLSKLDDASKQNYDEKTDFKSLPSWDTCYDILSHRCQFLESHGKKSEAHKPSGTKQKSNVVRSSNTFVNSNITESCSYCNSSEHNLANCFSFLSLVVSERFNFVKRNGHCINCLRKGHVVSKCPSKSRCRVCRSSHHSSLHFGSTPENSVSQISHHTNNTNKPSGSSAINQNQAENKFASTFVTRALRRSLIPTAVVLVKDSCGIFHPVRALLDSCSEINFILEETAKRLKLGFQPYTQEISGIGEVRTKIKSFVDATVKSRFNSFEWSSAFAVTKSISLRQPGEHIETCHWEILKTLQLADPLFYKPQRIDLLIGTEVFLNLLVEGQISLGDNGPTLKNTVFGWIAGGKFASKLPVAPMTCNLAIGTPEETLDSTLKKFWEIEDYISTPSKLNEEEQACEEHYIQNVVLKDNGKIQVRLPFKRSPEVLGDSFDMARRRFLALERRLDRDSTLKSMYTQFMDEYLSFGHMSLYNQPLVGPNFIIPHHCVLRPDSTTTKLRVVFDGSARSSSNISLNEILMVGPTIQQDLVTTLFSFRLNKFALTADISKMYRQFEVDERDRKYQLILWRNNKEEILKVFQLNTVTYGLSSAPFLAIRSLFFIADQHNSSFPLGSKTLREDLYVDDILTGTDDIETLLIKKAELVHILKAHGLELAKWSSNRSEITSNNEAEVPIKNSEDDVRKTLGMSWKPKQDIFCYRFNLPEVIMPTKRSVLSLVSKIYDLLGILSPIVVRCKILLQEIWVQNFDWDDELTEDLKLLWSEIKNDLRFIENIEIPRYVFTSSEVLGEIHGFADASQRAYGCCIYFRVLVKGEYNTTLLIAKSKVAPIKAQSLPRLELCAGILLSRTWDKIKSKMARFVSQVYFWTDSKIVLQWLKLHSSTLNCFVANRVSELQTNTRGIRWRHVPSQCNPADIVSRGCSAQALPSTIWFNGPSFLQDHHSTWPQNGNDDGIQSVVLEKRKAAVFICADILTSIIEEIIDKHSSFYKITRIISFVFRIFNRCPVNRSLKPEDVIQIQPLELDQTFWRIIAHIQASSFKDDIAAISNGKSVNPSLQKLAPFLHEMNVGTGSVILLRVGGRLAKAPIPYDARFPALVPKNHRFVILYIEYLHRLHLHAGPKVLLGIVRQRVWIINAREVVRKVVRGCMHCFHYKPKLMEQIMGNLPADRLRAQRPFLITGVDFCGPFSTSYRIRGKAPYKTYVAVFVCFSSKAVHLELVSDLSTNNFILCLRRFVGRRGLPIKIYCDNATNFVGAHNKLQILREKLFTNNVVQQIRTDCAQHGFEFCFIPPRAPHFGGLWEAAVKSAKSLLLKNVAEAHLTFEELQTLIIEIEAILNSRPIAAMTDDPNDGEAITPGHLLIGSSFFSIQQKHLEFTKLSAIDRWQNLSFLKNQFWQLWSRDYLSSLQQRSKWSKQQPNIEVGQLVLIHEDNTPPQKWHLGRVTEVFPGSDGRVRVVELKTASGISKRPIHKVAPLPNLKET